MSMYFGLLFSKLVFLLFLELSKRNILDLDKSPIEENKTCQSVSDFGIWEFSLLLSVVCPKLSLPKLV